jgi:hypothetical protein
VGTRHGIDVMREPEGYLIKATRAMSTYAFVSNGSRDLNLLMGDPAEHPLLAGQQPAWPATNEYRLASMRGLTSDGKNLWLLLPPDGAGGSLMRLAWFRPGHPDPVIVPIKLEHPTENIATGIRHDERLLHAQDRLILATGKRFWFIPMKDLEAAAGP